MNYLSKMRYLTSALLLGVVIASPALASNFLDDMIYSVKCSGADNVDACKAQAKQNFDDYTRKKNAGTAAGPRPNSTEAGTAGDTHNYRERCEEVSATGPADVDAAYNRAMNKYHFQTPEQQARVKHALPGFNHARVPGVRYDISTTIDFPGYGRRGNVDLTLAKSASGSGTNMNVKFCQTTSDLSPNPYFDSSAFWNDVSNDFRNLVQK